MNNIQKVIIPVGGFGTRFLPATKAQPKEMLPIVDKPVIQYLVEEAVASGIKEVIIVTGRAKRAIEDHFDYAAELEAFLESRGKADLAKAIRRISSMAFFAFVRQKEPKGIGDAILQACPLLGDEPVAVMSGDDIIDAKPPALSQLMRVFSKYRAPVVALKRIDKKDVYKYGVIKGKKIAARTWRINGLVEKPDPAHAPSDLMIIVKYILTPPIFNYLAQTKPAPNGEIYITDAVDKYVKNGGKLYGYEVKGEYYDCGDKSGFMRAVVSFGLKHPEIGPEFRKYLKSLHI
ncbi:MAG: UTP--glucose-1-phosphate uridylyltransferase GalU [Candidatus Sungbacteria bacterium]|nr:UTP--glucose-1-phosphate uridylyltransferase GalU [Candidatus Sungbacteria bacterium]